MSGWGQGEWDAHFNEANARRIAEAEATHHGIVARVTRRLPSRFDVVITVVFLLAQVVFVAIRVAYGIPPGWFIVAAAAVGGYLVARVVDHLRLAAAIARPTADYEEPPEASQR